MSTLILFSGVFLVLYAVVFYIENFFSRKKKPPGPLSIPPFGTLIQIGRENSTSYIALDQLARKYGDVMSLKMGFMDTVVLSSYKSIKDIFTLNETNARQCTGQLWDRNYQKNIGNVTIDSGGLAFAQGESWKQTRSLCQKALRQHGTGNEKVIKSYVPSIICNCLEAMENETGANSGMIYFTSDYFHKCFAKVMTAIVMGKNYDDDDTELAQLLQCQEEFIKNGVVAAGILMSYPFLRYIFPETLGYNSQMKGTDGFRKIAKEFLRRRSSEVVDVPVCLGDDFLKKMNEEKANQDLPPFFTDENFAVMFSDIMQGGIDITSNVVNFIVLLLAAHPASQEKCYQELLNVVGSGVPILEDKASLPYTQCVILEGLRWSRVGVLGVPRKALADIYYRGYLIRKGTTLISNLETVLFDPTYWEDPYVFRPDRYLEKDGSFNEEKVQRTIVFGTGKRGCVGEALARDTLFLFVTSLVQKFQFRIPAGVKPNLEPIMGIALYPHPYHAHVTLRNT